MMIALGGNRVVGIENASAQLVSTSANQISSRRPKRNQWGPGEHRPRWFAVADQHQEQDRRSRPNDQARATSDHQASRNDAGKGEGAVHTEPRSGIAARSRAELSKVEATTAQPATSTPRWEPA